MRIFWVIIMMIMLLTISGCADREVIKYNHTFRGENEFWSAEYKVKGTVAFIEKDGRTTHESDSNTTLTVTYKKDPKELSSVRYLEISYDTVKAGGGRLSIEFNDQSPPIEKTYVLNSSGKEFLYDIEIVKVNIIIDGEIQVIELEKQNILI